MVTPAANSRLIEVGSLMTSSVRELLDLFGRLSKEEQGVAAKEIWKRLNGNGVAPLSDEEFAKVADELFQVLDREEEIGA